MTNVPLREHGTAAAIAERMLWTIVAIVFVPPMLLFALVVLRGADDAAIYDKY
ncbi:hypothetical protein PX554_13840 [Sphingomonas sp. H39-1-10]|uniref:hypothetical protein n=1 Tax=Sphingomonas pollutisoli TaxID=3030829 RepID=UPI0023B8A211|nr:hypothetical protein [Sphingomonas pollutisoli]MDF0489218.1 hypothetical protein [Sphingomonas pollutisoli]